MKVTVSRNIKYNYEVEVPDKTVDFGADNVFRYCYVRDPIFVEIDKALNGKKVLNISIDRIISNDTKKVIWEK